MSLFGKAAPVIAAILLLIAPPTGPARAAVAPGTIDSGGPPNILVIVTDDQGKNTMSAMPETESWLSGGVRYPNAVVTTPLCCPSRASIMSGRYAHNTGVEDNSMAYELDQTETMQAQLRVAGYRTALFGKFLNSWSLGDDPPNFDDWAVFPHSKYAYEDAYWNIDGTVRLVNRYWSNFMGEQALGFISDAEGDDERPWLMMLSTPAPHAPYTPEARYAEARVDRTGVETVVDEDDPAVDPSGRADKPSYVRESQASISKANRFRIDQLRTLMSVDDMIAKVKDALRSAGESGNTLVVFISDNGLQLGEHRLIGKSYPYKESVQVPMFLRWPERVAPGIDERIVANIDIAPTVMDAAGIEPGYVLDGRSLLDPGWARDRILVELPAGNPSRGVPPWAGFYSPASSYIEHYFDPVSGAPSFLEYYDHTIDPNQLFNRFGDLDLTNDPPDAVQLSLDVRSARTCSGSEECP